MAALLTLIPVLLVLGLLLFGDYTGHRPAAFTPGRVLPVVGLAFLLGPVPVLVAGLGAWLVLWVLITGATLLFTILRQPPLRH